MKLKTFNTQNIQPTRSSSPFIGINTKTGVFAINRTAAEAIGIKDGDQVQFHQEEDSPENWYIEKVKDGGFTVRLANDRGILLFNNTTLSRMIFASVECESVSGRVLVGEAIKSGKQTLSTLITASLK